MSPVELEGIDKLGSGVVPLEPVTVQPAKSYPVLSGAINGVSPDSIVYSVGLSSAKVPPSPKV